MPVPLSTSTLSTLGQHLPIPAYQRAGTVPGIVHFGVGAFHRAHQAMYHDRLMNDGLALDWGICGVGVMPADLRMKEALVAQDGLYTLVVKHPDGTYQPRIIGSIVEYLFAPDDPERVIEAMATPATRIVSLTVTEGGYNIHHVTGEFDSANPAVNADLQPGATPRTTFGFVTEALRRRRESWRRAVHRHVCGQPRRATGTLRIGCSAPSRGDGIPSSLTGSIARCSSRTRWSTGLPRSRPKRIGNSFASVSASTTSGRSSVSPLPNGCSRTAFSDGRPPYEDAGVQVVDDVGPYELMKLRLLNAGHQALCYFGYLCGYRLVHDAAQDPLFRTFLLRYMDKEATPTLSPVPGVDLDEYKHTLIERFSNPEVRDTIARLCAESSDRIPKWLLPVIREQLGQGGEISRSAAVVASWARYAEGIDEEGQPIEVVDPLKEKLMAAAARNREDPDAFIANRQVFGDLVDDKRFVVAYRSALTSLHERGARATLKSLI